MNSIIRIHSSIFRNIASVRYCSGSQIPKNLLEKFTGTQEHHENGAIYEKKPFKLNLKAEKTYSWCLCGKSKSQPLCDGKH